ncbi:MAG: prepilin-type N-terminal cleavage/methylation domain-containing protein [Candidatus Omnitrophica bacterium]|nr:prepilin-type N-terminal cleavage/methylation domain-containing protein [Candidatus Omnitrophota bacterium]
MTRSPERGFTLVEIMIVVAIIALLAAIAIPNVLRGRTTANESSAVGNLRALVSSLEMFRSVNNAYPLTANWVADMYTTPTPDFGPPSFNHAMDGTACPPAVGSSCTQGFRYTYTSGAGTVYTINANPDVVGQTGTRSFFADESGVIRHCTGTGATVTDPSIDAAPIAC